MHVGGGIAAVQETEQRRVHSGLSRVGVCAGIQSREVVEVNGRLGWDEAFSDLFQVRTHQERIFQTIQLALGIEPELIRDESRFAAVAYRPCYYHGIVEDLPTRDELAQLEHDELKLGLATHEGALFVAPPDPETYPHVAWALATHPASSHVAYEMARQAVDKLHILIRRI